MTDILENGLYGRNGLYGQGIADFRLRIWGRREDGVLLSRWCHNKDFSLRSKWQMGGNDGREKREVILDFGFWMEVSAWRRRLFILRLLRCARN